MELAVPQSSERRATGLCVLTLWVCSEATNFCFHEAHRVILSINQS